MCIACGAVARKLAVDVRAALLRVLEALQHQDACAFAHDESRAIRIEGPRASRWVVVAEGVHRLHVAEASEAQGRDRRFAPAGNHHVGFSVADGGQR
eukprot:scaffold380_cov272-Pinguiococcus_pyrenoidosus.AAC.6